MSFSVTRRQAMGRLGQWGVVLSLAGGGASGWTAETVTVKDASGEVRMPLKPRTVLVFDLAALDTLQALGVDVQGVPNQKMPPLLERYADSAKYPQVGSLFEPDYEKIKALQPDLIIAGNRSLPKIAELKKFAPVLDVTVDNQKQIEEVYRNIRALAAIYGVREKGEAEIQSVEKAIAGLRTQAAKQGPGLFLMTNGGKLSVYGPGSRFDMLYTVFGMKPLPQKIEVSKHGQAVSFEYLLKANPEWLLVLDRDAAIGREGAAAQKLLDNKLVQATKAWRSQQVVYLNAANWYLLSNAGPGALKANIQQLSDAFSRR
ncbi:siderophore ABC transporter substrate-binding protein [Comamonas antarctica]|uniref:Siderophore ABC transporter substrate-binding protein n=1 Tax=Comamonas antarctica TaxID=2743470 RepID=A0A6N1X1G9_9BURK|nr:siderophore ABC transporter substrate-binding protein [Comamonas antarctica]QKV51600.1 siderophore ABC transporter substrate-binding protein [Comamonas antarctica]